MIPDGYNGENAVVTVLGTPADTDLATDMENIQTSVDDVDDLLGVPADTDLATDISNVQDVVDDILEDTGTTIPAVLGTPADTDLATDISNLDTKIDTIDGIVDDIKAALSTGIVTGNIKAGVTILGVAGKTEVVDTTEVANAAVAGDIALGKVAFVNGVKITGTHE